MAAAKTLITPEEYLAMSFDEREPEYVRGELVYKPMPDYAHSAVQALLTTLLMMSLRSLRYRVLTELRTQLAEDNFRLPDIAVYGPDQAAEPVPSHPPLVAIEIISKDESYTRMLQKLEDYQAWGVPNIWTVDPRRRKLSVFTADALKNVEVLSLAGTGFEVRIEQLLEDLPPNVL